MHTAPEKLLPSGKTRYLRFRDKILSVVATVVSFDKISSSAFASAVANKTAHKTHKRLTAFLTIAE